MWLTRENRDTGFRWLWYGVGLFLLGEVFCGINIYITQDMVLSWEILHGAGMVAGFSLFFYAAWRIIDSNVAHFSENSRPCVLLGFCGFCDREKGGCQYERLFGWFLLALAIMSVFPFFAPLKDLGYFVDEFSLREVVGLSWIPDMIIFPGGYEYVHPVILEVLDKRIYPGIALVSFLLSYFSLHLAGPKRDHLTMALFGMGMGSLSYAAMKVTLYSVLDELAFASLWEEGTELMFILLVFLTWRLFREGKAVEKV